MAHVGEDLVLGEGRGGAELQEQVDGHPHVGVDDAVHCEGGGSVGGEQQHRSGETRHGARVAVQREGAHVDRGHLDEHHRQTHEKVLRGLRGPVRDDVRNHDGVHAGHRSA